MNKMNLQWEKEEKPLVEKCIELLKPTKPNLRFIRKGMREEGEPDAIISDDISEIGIEVTKIVDIFDNNSSVYINKILHHDLIIKLNDKLNDKFSTLNKKPIVQIDGNKFIKVRDKEKFMRLIEDKLVSLIPTVYNDYSFFIEDVQITILISNNSKILVTMSMSYESFAKSYADIVIDTIKKKSIDKNYSSPKRIWLLIDERTVQLPFARYEKIYEEIKNTEFDAIYLIYRHKFGGIIPYPEMIQIFPYLDTFVNPDIWQIVEKYWPKLYEKLNKKIE